MISRFSTLQLPVPFFFAVAISLSYGHSNCRFTAKAQVDNNGGPNKNTSSSFSIKGMFVFGSSLVDNGNNNFLKTQAKANYSPYGVDFPLGPSGRFTNGRNVVDLIAQRLGLTSFIPPSSDPQGNETVNGVNFASGGSGILNDTGSIAGEVLSLNHQISAFEDFLQSDVCRNCSSSLSHYLFMVGSGGNDYTLNFFRRNPNASISNLKQFTNNLTQALTLHLQKLSSLGGRKFVLMALNPLGCSPSASPSQSGCAPSLDRAAKLFNHNLRKLAHKLNSNGKGAHFVLVDSYKIITDIINHPIDKGFTVTRTPCCEVPTVEQGGNGVLCKRNGSVCSNRTAHVFFDGLHPTEAVNVEIANKGFSSQSSAEVYPFNIHRLAIL